MYTDWTQVFRIKGMLLENLSQKLPKQNHLYLVCFIFEHISDLDIELNGTRRGLSPLILEEYLEIMYVLYMNTAGNMISLLEILFTFHCYFFFPGIFRISKTSWALLNISVKTINIYPPWKSSTTKQPDILSTPMHWTCICVTRGNVTMWFGWVTSQNLVIEVHLI